ncbi:hypothetical protein ACFV0L_06185 [Streptosporangium canum]|uniref:pectate lyase family protein n=1 Tax=Streptosporangium canum TaxID=324952 RepID=UPI0036758EE4
MPRALPSPDHGGARRHPEGSRGPYGASLPPDLRRNPHETNRHGTGRRAHRRPVPGSPRRATRLGGPGDLDRAGRVGPRPRPRPPAPARRRRLGRRGPRHHRRRVRSGREHAHRLHPGRAGRRAGRPLPEDHLCPGATDSGKLKVTVHHNHFDNALQRLPRVRFGQVHVYNNYYEAPDASAFVYALGVGVQSQIFAENNFFRLGRAVDPAKLLYNWGGTALTARGNVLRVGGRVTPVDLVAAHNAANDPDLGADAGWTPTLHTGIDPAESVRLSVSRHAGAGHAR